MSDPSPRSNVLQYEVAAAAPSPREPWGWIELFVLVQLLWGALLFIPGAQPYRMAVRALPYVASLGAFAFSLRRRTHGRLPTSGSWLLASFALLLVNLLHSETRLNAGLAQVVFQISIAAPMFWVAGLVQQPGSPRSAAVGHLRRERSQRCSSAYCRSTIPTWFLPPEFSALARSLNPAIIDALSYIGPDGQLIVRPPGLSDLPGGAAVAGLTTVVLGIGYVSHCEQLEARQDRECGRRRRRHDRSLPDPGAIADGHGRLRCARLCGHSPAAGPHSARRMDRGSAASRCVATSFMWASAIGGKADRRHASSDLLETGLFITFQRKPRAVSRLYLPRPVVPVSARRGARPLGNDAGVLSGSCDVAITADPRRDPDHRLAARRRAVRCGSSTAAPSRRPCHWRIDRPSTAAATDRCATCPASSSRSSSSIVGLCLTGPVFNTQLGVLFWTVTGALFGAVRGAAEHEFDESDAAEAQWTT